MKSEVEASKKIVIPNFTILELLRCLRDYRLVPDDLVRGVRVSASVKGFDLKTLSNKLQRLLGVADVVLKAKFIANVQSATKAKISMYTGPLCQVHNVNLLPRARRDGSGYFWGCPEFSTQNCRRTSQLSLSKYSLPAYLSNPAFVREASSTKEMSLEDGKVIISNIIEEVGMKEREIEKVRSERKRKAKFGNFFD